MTVIFSLWDVIQPLESENGRILQQISPSSYPQKEVFRNMLALRSMDMLRRQLQLT